MFEQETDKTRARLKRALDDLYARYNRREFVHPDPLEFLYAYDDPKDREIAGLVASSLAYGQVNQILKSASFVLERMPSPSRFLEKTSAKSLGNKFANFKYRFTTGEELAAMLIAAKRARSDLVKSISKRASTCTGCVRTKPMQHFAGSCFRRTPTTAVGCLS